MATTHDVAVIVGWPAAPAALLGAALCFELRVLAIKHGWQLPVAAAPADRPPAEGEMAGDCVRGTPASGRFARRVTVNESSPAEPEQVGRM